MLEETLKEQINGVFSCKDRIAVKVHMGETNNKYYLKAPMIKRVIDVLKELGVTPFLFDSPVKYPGGRDTVEKYYRTAELHGFTEDLIGCPIIISDESIDVKTKDFVIHVCNDIADADGLLVLSHTKGHSCSAFGGAIKNLGMGCVSKKSKIDIHSGSCPVFVKECEGCGSCVNVCPGKAIEMTDGKIINEERKNSC